MFYIIYLKHKINSLECKIDIRKACDAIDKATTSDLIRDYKQRHGSTPDINGGSKEGPNN